VLKKKEKNVAQFCDKYDEAVANVGTTRINTKDFEEIKIIGRGGFGTVKLVKRTTTGEVLALKCMSKYKMVQTTLTEGIDFNWASDIWAERDILTSANSPWVLAMRYAFQDEQYLYAALEYMGGGDLLNCMENHEFPEEWAKFYVKEMLLAIEVVHNIGYVHRDIKPDNVLLDASGHVKLADFGTCTRIIDERGRAKARDLIGTHDYLAPEVLAVKSYDGKAAKSYTKAVDIWAIGCIMAELMTSKPIFYTKNADKSKDPYHVDQLREIIRIMGCPVSVDGKPKDPSREWQGMNQLPKYKKLQEDFPVNSIPPHIGLETYLRQKSPSLQRGSERTAKAKLKLLVSLLRMDPQLRVSAQAALQTKYFKDTDFSKVNAFEGVADFDAYPKREYKVPEDKGSGKKVGAGVDTSKPFFPEFNPARTPKRFAVADEACESRQKKGKV